MAGDNMSAHGSCLVHSFWRNIKSPRWLTLLQPRFRTRWLLAFSKTITTFGREEISDCWWDLGKYDGAADGDYSKKFCRECWTVEETLGELCEAPRSLLWRGLRHHCPVYNVSLSCTFNKCLYFLYYIDGYFLGRPHRVKWVKIYILLGEYKCVYVCVCV